MGVFQRGINNLLAEAGVVATVLSKDIKTKKKAVIKPQKTDEGLKTDEIDESNVKPQNNEDSNVTRPSNPNGSIDKMPMERANANAQEVINQQARQKRNYKKREDLLVKRAKEKAQEKLINSKFEKEMKPNV